MHVCSNLFPQKLRRELPFIAPWPLAYYTGTICGTNERYEICSYSAMIIILIPSSLLLVSYCQYGLALSRNDEGGVPTIPTQSHTCDRILCSL